MADKMKVRILRDFWGEPNADGTENRFYAGQIIEMTIDEAFTGIEAGMVERVKDEPKGV